MTNKCRFKTALLTIIAAHVYSFSLLVSAAYPQTTSRDLQIIVGVSETDSALPDFNWFTRGPKREFGAHQAMWEPLFILDHHTGLLKSWLALDISPDSEKKVWKLILREGVFWSDSGPAQPKPFDADDVVFTANTVISHDELPAAEAATFRSQVESVRKIDNLTVEFTLRKPNPRFALENFGGGMFSSFLILPKHIWEGQDPMTFKFFKMENGKIVQPVGTGPYVLKDIDNEQVVWERNDQWWGVGTALNPEFKPLPQPQTLIWRYFSDAKSAVDALKNNQIDVGPELSFDEMTALQAANPKTIDWDATSDRAWNDPCARQLEVNADSKNAPWDNPKLRQALSLAIDRQAIADTVYQGTTLPSRTMFYEVGAMNPFVDAVVNAALGVSAHADPAAAAALIEGEGYAKGADNMYYKGTTPLSLAISVNQDIDLDAKSVDLIVRQLKAAGIAARPLAWTTPEFWGRIVPQGSYEAAYSWLSCGSIAEPWTSMSRYTIDKVAPIGSRSPGFDNTGRWSNQAYSDIVNVMGAMPVYIRDTATNTDKPNPDIPPKVVEAYKYLNAEMPFIPIVQSVKIIPFNTTYWKGWPTADDDGTPADEAYTAPMASWSRARLIVDQLTKAGP